MAEDSSARKISETTVMNVAVSMAYDPWMRVAVFPQFTSGVDILVQSDGCAKIKDVAIRQVGESESLTGKIGSPIDMDSMHVRGDLAGFTECVEVRGDRTRSCQSTVKAGLAHQTLGSGPDGVNPICRGRWRGGGSEDEP